MTTATTQQSEGRAAEPPHEAVTPGRFRHVIACLDRSFSAEVCIPYAQTLARAFDAKVTLLHVMQSGDDARRDSGPPDALEWEIRRLEADHYLQTVRTTLPPRAMGETATEVRQGPPAERIVATAREIGGDLTVLAGHDDVGAHAIRLGATTQLVLAHGSLLLTHPGSAANVPPKRIIVPLDGSTRAESVLPVVVALARTYSASVVLLHVVSDPTPNALLSDPSDYSLAQSLANRLAANAGRYLAHQRERSMREVPAVQTLVTRHADVRLALLEAGTQLHGDLVVVTAHGVTCDASQPCGSVTAYLLANSLIPLLVLQDAPAGEEPRQSTPPPRPSAAPPGQGF